MANNFDEERLIGANPLQETATTDNTLDGGLDRRDIIRLGAALLTSSTVALTGEASANSEEAASKFAQKGDRFKIVRGQLRAKVLQVNMLQVGARPVEAFPLEPVSGTLRRRNRLNRILLVRLDPSEMSEATRARSVDGILAYSALCTHRACTIKSWKPQERHLRCHCHLSEFAALEEGGVTTGPAKRQLPMIPLAIDEKGYVIATDGFTAKPGGAKK